MAAKAPSKLKNFITLTAQVTGVEHKLSKAGKPYAVGMAAVPQANDEPPLFLRVVALDEVSEFLADGLYTLSGRLGYEEDREKRGILVLYPTKIEPPPSDGRMRNFAMLTLRVGSEPYARYSDAARFWVRLRAFLGMGKTADGKEYKPSLWLTVKAFATKEGDERLPAAIAALNKGEQVTFCGRLAWEVYKDKGNLTLFAYKVEKLLFEPETTEEQECPV
jgi:hypothetical protein